MVCKNDIRKKIQVELNLIYSDLQLLEQIQKLKQVSIGELNCFHLFIKNEIRVKLNQEVELWLEKRKTH